MRLRTSHLLALIAGLAVGLVAGRAWERQGGGEPRDRVVVVEWPASRTRFVRGPYTRGEAAWMERRQRGRGARAEAEAMEP